MDGQRASILSDKQIVEEYLKKNIIITDFKDENLGNCSYDVTLGKYFYACALPKESAYNPYSENSMECWQLCEAATLEQWEEIEPAYILRSNSESRSIAGSNGFKADMGSIKDTDLVIWLHPRSTILAHTNEFIGGRQNITTMMKARSSIGRNYIQVCHCAGLGDIGYINRWTMEISNNSDYFIPLVVGTRVAQIVFFYTGDCLTSYSKKKTSKYQKEYSSLKEMRDSWKPEHMLPRLYMDSVKENVVKQESVTDMGPALTSLSVTYTQDGEYVQWESDSTSEDEIDEYITNIEQKFSSTMKEKEHRRKLIQTFNVAEETKQNVLDCYSNSEKEYLKIEADREPQICRDLIIDDILRKTLIIPLGFDVTNSVLTKNTLKINNYKSLVIYKFEIHDYENTLKTIDNSLIDSKIGKGYRYLPEFVENVSNYIEEKFDENSIIKIIGNLFGCNDIFFFASNVDKEKLTTIGDQLKDIIERSVITDEEENFQSDTYHDYGIRVDTYRYKYISY